MLRYVLHIKASPYHNQACRTALRFAEALIKKGHLIAAVFFSGEAVVIANQYAQIPSDEECLRLEWQGLSAERGFSLDVCSAAALRRGIISESGFSQDHQGQSNVTTLANGFNLSGLATLVEAIATADRTITFG